VAGVPVGREWWPARPELLISLQQELAVAADRVERWLPSGQPRVGACFVAAGRPAGGWVGTESAWAAAVLVSGSRLVARAVRRGAFPAPYAAGLLALREGALLEDVVRDLGVLPDVLVVNATGRDHPRRAGLALHLGAALGVPSVGVTDRPLLAGGPEPGPEAGARAPLLLDGVLVGFRLRARAETRPLVVHAGWRVDPEDAVAVVWPLVGGARTPEPMRLARRLARTARAEEIAAGG
jgi:deoxyribonuclease V